MQLQGKKMFLKSEIQIVIVLILYPYFFLMSFNVCFVSDYAWYFMC